MDTLERAAVIGEIVRQKQGRSGRLGKTAVMKLLHLLQDGLHVPLGYRFSLYNYGPYDTEVMSDIDFAEVLGQISVSYLGEEQGYQILPSAEKAQRLRCPESAKAGIDKLVEEFGQLNARELELRSTLLFLSNDFRGDQLISRLRELKPKYSEVEVRDAASEMSQIGLLRAAG